MNDPYELCASLLDLVVSGFEGAGVGLPGTRYVAPGQSVAYDGEQVTTNLTRFYGGMPGNEQIVQHSGLDNHSIDIQVAIVRTTPVIDEGAGEPIPPSTKDLEESAALNMADAKTLRLVLEAIRRDATLVDRGVPFGVSPVMTQGPQGGIVAVTAVVSVQVI